MLDLPSRSRRMMWPLPLDSTPSFGCQAGPSPPAPPSASTFSFAFGAKIASSAFAEVVNRPHRIRAARMTDLVGKDEGGRMKDEYRQKHGQRLLCCPDSSFVL